MSKQNHTYSNLNVAATCKTPQVQQLITALSPLATHEKVTDEQIIATLNKSKKLITRQDPFLIFRYYRKTLIEVGFMTCKTMRHVVPTYWNYEGMEQSVPVFVPDI